MFASALSATRQTVCCGSGPETLLAPIRLSTLDRAEIGDYDVPKENEIAHLRSDGWGRGSVSLVVHNQARRRGAGFHFVW